jgi:hypothetical protein
MSSHIKLHLVAVAAASLLTAGLSQAQGTATPSNTAPMTAPRTAPATSPTTASAMGERDRVAMKTDKDALERKLQAVSTRDGYAKALKDAGYRISAINSDKPDYLEYEVVKGNHSLEVQLDFDKGASKASKIDVANNMWRADATERMMKDPGYAVTAPMMADPTSRYSDRRYMAGWNDEKGRLEKSLPANLPVAQYKGKLEQMGYKVTSVNDRDAGSLEYEIVKGDHSYEVDIAFDPATKIATKVDVDSNLWDADGTERAKDRNEKVGVKR